MKFSKFLTPFALLATAVSAATTTTSPALRLGRRDLLDLCVDVKLDLVAELNKLLGLNLLDLGAKVDLCLCVSALPLFIKANLVAGLAADILGDDVVIAALEALINANHPTQCTLPPHANSICTAGNPCAFQCIPPFVASPDGKTCVLPPSTKAKRSMQELAINAFDDLTCRTTEMRCPVPNYGGHRDNLWECVDVRNNLFACGGCTTAPAYGDFSEMKMGTDCAMIRGVSDVECAFGMCNVKRCMRGWKVGVNGTDCVRA